MSPRERGERIDAATQAELVLAWQSCTDALTRDRLATEVLESLEGLLRSLVTRRSATLGSSWAHSAYDDLLCEARVAALEALTTWRPGGGSRVSSWVASCVRRALERYDVRSGGGILPREWKSVARVAFSIKNGADAAGEHLSADELRRRVEESFWSKTRAQRMVQHPDADEAEIDRLVHDRLSRQSLIRAFNEISEIMVAAGAVDSLDYVDDTGTALIDKIADDRVDPFEPELDETSIVDLLLRGLPAREVAVLHARYASAKETTVAELAASFDLDKPVVKAILLKGAARVTSPHAQWCRLAPDVDQQVVRVVAPVGPAARVARRVAAASGR
jgi:hypothetical protein